MKARISKIIQETHNVKILRMTPEDTVTFDPGQFIMIEYDKNSEKSKIKRAYSIANSPMNTNYLELAFDLKPFGVVSTYLYNLKENDVIEITQPKGYFTFHNYMKEDIILIGAGTGIVPLICIARYIVEKNLPNNVTLIYSCKTKNDIIYYNEMKTLRQTNNRFAYLITLTQDNDWKGLTGRINIELIKSILRDLSHKYYFICGPPQMVIALSKGLVSEGVLKDHVKIEGYE